MPSDPRSVIRHIDIGFALHRQIRQGKITLAGNSRLKIYGLLSCYSGKRMKKENRVFFTDEAEALAHGFRPCKNCMRQNESRR
ncbi:MAG: metal-binding protein [Bacteroidetes bacterium]|nr:metal-binding protein [Bacteroidota bacterium]